jgi:hypothetical protein
VAPRACHRLLGDALELSRPIFTPRLRGMPGPPMKASNVARISRVRHGSRDQRLRSALTGLFSA